MSKLLVIAIGVLLVFGYTSGALVELLTFNPDNVFLGLIQSVAIGLAVGVTLFITLGRVIGE